MRRSHIHIYTHTLHTYTHTTFRADLQNTNAMRSTSNLFLLPVTQFQILHFLLFSLKHFKIFIVISLVSSL